jgi:hypothetical protein
LQTRDRAPAECGGRNLILVRRVVAYSRCAGAILAMAIWLTAMYSLSSSAQSNLPNEYQVKAAFLYNFAKFVEWPSDAFPDEKTPITLCIFAEDPFGGVLDEIVRGRAINNRPLAIRRTNALAGLKGCHLVFVGVREDKRLPEMLEGLKGSSALVVGESEGFAERGGAIQFYLDNNRVRFIANVDAVQRARLSVSSKLLALARIVHDQGHSKEN